MAIGNKESKYIYINLENESGYTGKIFDMLNKKC